MKVDQLAVEGWETKWAWKRMKVEEGAEDCTSLIASTKAPSDEIERRKSGRMMV